MSSRTSKSRDLGIDRIETCSQERRRAVFWRRARGRYPNALKIAVLAAAILAALPAPVFAQEGDRPPRGDAPTLTPLPAGLLVEWPPVIANPTVTEYEVRYRAAPGDWVTVSSGGVELATSTPVAYLIEGLEDSRYLVQYRSVNDVGAGRWSPSAAAVPLPAPTPTPTPTPLPLPQDPIFFQSQNGRPPAPVLTTPGHGRIVVTRGSADNVVAWQIRYRWSGSPQRTVNIGNSSTSFTLAGLVGGERYTVRYRVCSSPGTCWTDWSAASQATPTRPSTPTPTPRPTPRPISGSDIDEWTNRGGRMLTSGFTGWLLFSLALGIMCAALFRHVAAVAVGLILPQVGGIVIEDNLSVVLPLVFLVIMEVVAVGLVFMAVKR